MEAYHFWLISTPKNFTYRVRFRFQFRFRILRIRKNITIPLPLSKIFPPSKLQIFSAWDSTAFFTASGYISVLSPMPCLANFLIIFVFKDAEWAFAVNHKSNANDPLWFTIIKPDYKGPIVQGSLKKFQVIFFWPTGGGIEIIFPLSFCLRFRFRLIKISHFASDSASNFASASRRFLISPPITIPPSENRRK